MYSYQNNIIRIFSAEVLTFILGETCIKATLKCKVVVSGPKSSVGLYLEQQSRTVHMSERVGHKFVGRGSTILHVHSWQAPLHLDLEKIWQHAFVRMEETHRRSAETTVNFKWMAIFQSGFTKKYITHE